MANPFRGGPSFGVREDAFVDKMSYLRMHWACESCEYSSSSSSEDEYGTYSMSSDPAAELEIPVWVDGIEKWVTGLTRRTTCDDVIYALISFQEGGAFDPVELQSYAMYERWRDVERPLKGRTRILKVWRAWGSECRNVSFYVKKVDNPYESGSEMMKPRRSRRHGCSGYGNHSSRSRDREARRREREAHSASRRQDRSRRRTIQDRDDRRRQRRISRSMEHIWDDFDMCDSDALPAHAKYPTADEPIRTADNTKNRFFHELVQLILNQEKQIHEQTTRLQQTDVEIQNYETKIHMMRVQKNGANYVQDSYLNKTSEGNNSDDGRPTYGIVIRDEQEVDAYVEMCEKILKIQERISEEEQKIEQLTKAIFSEIQTPDASDNFSLASGYDGSPARLSGRHSGDDPEPDDDVTSEIARLRSEIQRSIALSVAQQKQMELVEDTLRQCEVEIRRRTLYANQLALELRESQTEHGLFGMTTLLKSKSCETLLKGPVLPPPDADGRNSEYDRPQYSSDSGVESVDNKTDGSDKTDVSLSPKSDHGFVDGPPLYATTASGRKMVPYLTYATYESSDRRHADPTLPVTCPKTNASDDSNSDTGLSSLHSDETSPILETLV